MSNNINFPILSEDDKSNELINYLKSKCLDLEKLYQNKDCLKKYYLLEEEVITKVKEYKFSKKIKHKIYHLLYDSFFKIRPSEIIANEVKLHLETNIKINFYNFYFSMDNEANQKKLFHPNLSNINIDKTQNMYKTKSKRIHTLVWDKCIKTILCNYNEIDFLPFFLIYHEKDLLMFKIDEILFYKYHYPFDLMKTYQDQNYLFLKKIFHLWINEKINIFDNQFFDEETRLVIFDFLLLSNHYYITKSLKNKKIFCNNAKKYIILLGLGNHYNELIIKIGNLLVEKDLKLINDLLIEAKEKLLYAIYGVKKEDDDDEEEANSNIIKTTNESNEKMLFFIFSISNMLNGFSDIMEIESPPSKEKNDEPESTIDTNTNKENKNEESQNDSDNINNQAQDIEYKPTLAQKLHCSSKERRFLTNILKIINGFEINYIIESFVFQTLIKSYTKILYDENEESKKIFNTEEIINLISTANTNLNNITPSNNPDNIELEINYFIQKFNQFKLNFTQAFENDSKSILQSIQSPKSIFQNLKSNFEYLKQSFTSKKNSLNFNLKGLQLIPISHYQTSTHICILIDGNFTSKNESFYKNIPLYTLVHSSNNVNCDFYYYNWQNEENFYVKDSSFTDKNKDDDAIIIWKEGVINRKIAKFYGKLLAYLIVSRSIFTFQSISLIGVSLGCEVIKQCLLEMNKISYDVPCDDIINNVVFVGGASIINLNKHEDIFDNVAGRIVNVFSEKDTYLDLYKKNCVGVMNMGYNKYMAKNTHKGGKEVMESAKEKEKRKIFIENIDLTAYNMNQLEYKANILKILIDEIKIV